MLKSFISFLLLFLFFFSGCSSVPVVENLNGTWESADSNGSHFKAEIVDNFITIDLVTDDISGIYWQGSFSQPYPVANGAVIPSEADVDALSGSILASGDASKDFTFSDGTLRFKFSAMGITKDISLIKK